MKKQLRRTLTVMLCGVLAAGGAWHGASYLKEKNQTTVMVVKVSAVADTYYRSSSTLDGSITSNVTQDIKVDSDVIIDQVYVERGQSVKTGDILMSFDNTLIDMELNIARLKRQKQEQDLATAQNRLVSLQNGGPVIESDSSGVNADNLAVGFSSIFSLQGDMMLGSILPAFYLAELTSDLLTSEDGISETYYEEEIYEAEVNQEEIYGEEIYQEDILTSDDSEDIGQTIISESNGQTVIEDGTVTFLSPEDVLTSDDEETADDTMEEPDADELLLREQIFYMILDYESEPFTGSGTEADPFVFLCSRENGEAVILKGSFFNKMAGYNADGSEILTPGGYWFRLEFHTEDTVINPLDRTESLEAYYYIDGSLLEEAVNPDAEVELSLEDAIQNETEQDVDWGYSYDTSYSGTTSGLTRTDAIKIQQMRIASLTLDLQESDIKISKLEKKAAVTQVVSRLDGVVSFLGDASTGTSISETFMKIQSEEGYYIRGTVSELMLDQVTVGTRLSCSGYESGMFEAEIIDLSDYPVDSSDTYYYYGDSNPNVSYYTFTASIGETSGILSDSDWISITVLSDDSDTGGIVLSKALVRSENGVSYVYKDVNGILQKQVVKVKEVVNSGYSVLIGEGLSEDDLIAFPYGSSTADGVQTREVSADEFYGY